MATLHGKAIETALQAWVTNATSVELRYLKSYTENPDHSYLSDISASIAAGAPTPVLSGVTVAYDATNNRVTFDFTNPSDGSITTDTDGIAIIDNTGTPTTSEVLYTTAITNLRPTDGTLSLTLDANGLFGVNMAAS